MTSLWNMGRCTGTMSNTGHGRLPGGGYKVNGRTGLANCNTVKECQSTLGDKYNEK